MNIDLLGRKIRKAIQVPEQLELTASDEEIKNAPETVKAAKLAVIKTVRRIVLVSNELECHGQAAMALFIHSADVDDLRTLKAALLLPKKTVVEAKEENSCQEFKTAIDTLLDGVLKTASEKRLEKAKKPSSHHKRKKKDGH